jgi:hypothetical protein
MFSINSRRLYRSLRSPRELLTVFALLFAQALAPIAQSDQLTISSFPQHFEYFKYRDGHIVGKEVIHHGDPRYDALRSMLRRQSNDWIIDVNSYAPMLYFKSDQMYVNCRDDLIVVNFVETPSGRWKQMSNPIHGCREAVLAGLADGTNNGSN